jgi:hypothetical protein
MSEMIERVARAIWGGEASTAEQWDVLSGDEKREWRLRARAAVAAMSEEDLRVELAYRKFQTQFSPLPSGCLQWNGAVDRRDGYGRFYNGSGKTLGAHQFIWRYCRGEVPHGLVIDHICGNRRCVNIDHLRIVTNAENVLAGTGFTARHKVASMCGRGHDLSNAYVRPNGQRMCRDCQNERGRQYRARKASLIDAALK